MTPDTPLPRWVLYRSACYLLGKGVHYGSAPGRITHARDANGRRPALDSGKYVFTVDPRKGGDADVVDDSLAFLAPRSMDWVLLDGRSVADPHLTKLFRQTVKVLGNGGHLMVVRETSQDMQEADLARAGSWIKKDSQTRDGFTFHLYKYVAGGKKGVTEVAPLPGKRACIVRYGALGDQVTITPLIRLLAEDGYAVTVSTQVNASGVIEHNPFVSNILRQERDIVPNPELGEYWAEWKGCYDRYINLSESVEGSLLRVEGRMDFYTPAAWRRAHAEGVNYYDRTMEVAGYPQAVGLRPELYFTDKEERKVAKFLEPVKDRFVVDWVLRGSSHHKMYPLVQPLLKHWLEARPDTVACLSGGSDAAGLAFDHPQVVNLVGKWPVRQSMLLTKYANLVVGPETGLMNAAGCWDQPKILLLSHSAADNISKHWANCTNVTPDPELAPCHPCYQMHYTKESCPLAELADEKTDQTVIVAPKCTIGIPPERILEPMTTVYDRWKGKAP